MQKKKKNTNDILVFSLGGLGAVGMNMYVVQCLDEIIIMDAGVLFAGGETPGVDYIIPDFTYLIENQDKIKAMFITHGHEDHIGGLPFLLEKVNIPVIYASGIAFNLIKNKMFEYPNISYNLKNYYDDSEFEYNNFTVTFFRTNHSIPDSFGVAIKTRLGYIVNTGDFKFDFTPVGPASDYYKMTKLGHEGVLCLMADSTNADIKTFSQSEKRIAENIRHTFAQVKGRIIVATFASNVYRVQHILEACQECGRKVAIFGHSMEKNIEAAMRLKYININKDLLISQRDIHNYEPHELTILCTGSQGEPLAALSRIANGTHKQIKLLENDTIIYSSKPIPGNEQFINRNINKLIRNGATIILNNPLTDTHTTGHASREEMKLMLQFMKPKYFMPVHGEYNMLKQHANIAIDLGLNKNNCFCLNPGDVLHFNEKGAKVVKDEIYAADVFLDSNFSDVNSNILKERKHLADEGMLSLVFTINKQKELLSPVRLDAKGFIDFTKESKLKEDIIKKATALFVQIINKHKTLNIKLIRNNITIAISNYIYELTERNPFIIATVNII